VFGDEAVIDREISVETCCDRRHDALPLHQ
jgi:hypothetical protein